MPFGKAKAAAQKPEAAAPRTHLSRTAGPCPCSDCTPPGAVPSLGRYCAWRGGFFRLPDGEKAWPDDLKVSPGLAWFDGNVARWETLLKNTGWLRPCGCCPGRPPPPAEKSISSLAVLELGSWEGNSTAWMLSHMCWRPGDYVVAVDDWSFASQGASKEVEAELKEKVAAAEEYFDFNTSKACVADQGAGKLIKRRGHTATVLPELGREGFEFDFCYIDASHAPEDVLRDAILAWPLMKSGGVIMFDDYGQHHWESETCPIALRAKSEDRKAHADTQGFMGLGVKSDMSSWFEIVLGPEGPYTSEPRLTGRPDGCQCTGRSSVYVYGMPDGSQKQTHGTCTANRESSIHSVCIREIMLDTDVICFFGADLICKRTQARTLPYTPSSLAPPHTLQRRRRVPCGIQQTL